jgi:sugar-specific transcriptional regulator TrmB
MVYQLKEKERDEAVQTLINLGLTFLQTKVYITLIKSGASTGRTTARKAQVASQDVYRILNELQEKGLIEKIVTKPAMYKATPFKEGVSVLLQNKKEEYLEIEEQAKMVNDLSFENINPDTMQEKLHFIIDSEYTLIKKAHEKMAKIAKKSIDIIVPLRMNQRMVFHDWSFLERAARRGVKIRIITQKANGESSSRNPKTLSEDLLFEHRYLSELSIPFGIHIFDKLEMTFSLSKKPVPGMRTDNPNVIKLAETYFENMWTKAQIN